MLQVLETAVPCECEAQPSSDPLSPLPHQLRVAAEHLRGPSCPAVDAILDDLRHALPGHSMALFGSVAYGLGSAASDVDVTALGPASTTVASVGGCLKSSVAFTRYSRVPS